MLCIMAFSLLHFRLRDVASRSHITLFIEITSGFTAPNNCPLPWFATNDIYCKFKMIVDAVCTEVSRMTKKGSDTKVSLYNAAGRHVWQV